MKNNQFAAAWQLVRGYWVSEVRWGARGLLALVIALDLLLVYRAARITFWQKDFYDALSGHNQPAFWNLIAQLAVIAALGIAMDASRTYTTQCLEMRWRNWISDVFLQRWLSGHACYRIEQQGGTDNPDQRVAEDLRLLVSTVLTLGLGLLSNLVNLATFSTIVWGLSGALSLVLAGHAIEVPGYMLWIALIYAIGGSIAMERIGGKLVAVDYRQQRAEADFRFLLMRIRENAEQIALCQGQAREQVRLRHSFAAILENWRHVMTYTKRIIVVDSLYTEAGAMVPNILNGPRYFAGAITLGGLIQLTQSFMKVRVALSWFIYKYKDLARLRSVCQRLIEFDQALNMPPPSDIRIERHDRRDGAALEVRGLRLDSPQGRPLVRVPEWRVAAGERWLVRGASGVGKSTLLRALAGLWPYGGGRIAWPQGWRVMFVPQRSYLPAGTMRACLSYPGADGDFAPAACADALRAVRLGGFVDELDRDEDWSRRLSPGEQQRLVFARVLLQRPDCLFLDEASASLDAADEARLYGLLMQHLPGIALISVAHRESLLRFHTDVLEVHGDSRALARPIVADGHRSPHGGEVPLCGA